jgi:hypothetical protein
MKAIALALAALMILLGLTGVLWPEGVMGLAKYSFTATGLYVIAVARMLLGALLLLAARATRTPKTVLVIGLLIFVAGIATALMGVERAKLLGDWLLDRGPDFLRLAACLPLAAGCFIAVATLTKGSRS